MVPTGAWELPSPTAISAIEAKRCPDWTNNPNKLSKVPLGSLNGRGCMASRKEPAGASTSLNSPG